MDNPALNNAPPMPVVFTSKVFPETFDIIITDECYSSIYNLWQQVMEYFDAYLIGLMATPLIPTFIFNENLVMEYSRQCAVVDGVNVDGQVYFIK